MVSPKELDKAFNFLRAKNVGAVKSTSTSKGQLTFGPNRPLAEYAKKLLLAEFKDFNAKLVADSKGVYFLDISIKTRHRQDAQVKKTLILRKDSIITRTDMAMSNKALSKLSSLKNSGKILASCHTKLESCQKDILDYMNVVKTQKDKWKAFKASLSAGSSKEEDFDLSSIEARLTDLETLSAQLKLAAGRIGTVLKTSKGLPHKCDEFTNTAAKFAK